MFRSIILLSISLAVSSAYAATIPTPDPVKFFTGHTRSVGVFENRHGEPTQLVKTETWGRLINGELHLEQDLFIGSQPRTHRSWKIHRIDARHFEATANDVLGHPRGSVTGNCFSWTFTLALKPGNPWFNVQMRQHMYFQPDRRTMVNRSIIRKFGVIVAEVTEQFERN